MSAATDSRPGYIREIRPIERSSSLLNGLQVFSRELAEQVEHLGEVETDAGHAEGLVCSLHELATLVALYFEARGDVNMERAGGARP